MVKEAFHTQECRNVKLTAPKKCVRFDAWLGEAYYFWLEKIDAQSWGKKSKGRNGYFEIYQCAINSENFLDTVFNEEHYRFWLNQLEKIAMKIILLTNEKPTLKELNDYIKDHKIWEEIDYIKFQDLPINKEDSFIRPIEYSNNKVRTVAFRKRIQLAVYNKDVISNFKFESKEKIR